MKNVSSANAKPSGRRKICTQLYKSLCKTNDTTTLLFDPLCFFNVMHILKYRNVTRTWSTPNLQISQHFIFLQNLKMLPSIFPITFRESEAILLYSRRHLGTPFGPSIVNITTVSWTTCSGNIPSNPSISQPLPDKTLFLTTLPRILPKWRQASLAASLDETQHSRFKRCQKPFYRSLSLKGLPSDKREVSEI